MIDTAFILGAGLGTRLRPLTERTPKPLLPIGGKPMICHAMDRLIKAGIKQFIINTHHCANAYAEVFPDGTYRGCPIKFVYEPILLDTGGGLKNIEPFWGTSTESIFVYNGDIFAMPDLSNLARVHTAGQSEVTLLLRSQGEPCNVRLGDSGSVLDMRGRLGRDDGKACLFTGIYIVHRNFLKTLEPGKVESVVEGFLRRIIARPDSIQGLLDDSGFWYDLGTVVDYERVKEAYSDVNF
ncbi:MAG: nucleotidyltransferase family protein [Puniceicoccales bacterium]|jgi:NDP-sugar pyrophosphorylase family protein|nr:nucleotidyltransferase family protein [Puniceicoccales bacterium]